MLSLALDTATRWGRFALADAGRLLGYQPLNVSGNFADAILPAVGELLSAAQRRLGDVAAIGVTCGPGSFTGVRIGVATAKGLAYGLGARLAAVPTTAAMGAALLAEQPGGRIAVPVLDARRGEVFAGIYRRCGTWVEPLAEPTAASPDIWWQRVCDLVPDLSEAVWGGDGLPLLLGQGPSLRPEMRTGGEPARRNWSAAHPDTARALAVALSDPGAEMPEIHPFALVPLYLRLSDAERKKHIDLTPLYPDPVPDGDGDGPSAGPRRGQPS